jgi:hypothetical protein
MANDSVTWYGHNSYPYSNWTKSACDTTRNAADNTNEPYTVGSNASA